MKTMSANTLKKTKSPTKVVTVIKVKKVAQPLTKKEKVEPVSTVKTSKAKAVSKEKALSKEDLTKRQHSKGTNRKQGGKKFSALKADQLKAMAHILEAAATKVD
jgi:hypothetical protein